MGKNAIKSEIEIELKNLDKLAGEMETLKGKFINEPDFIQMRAAGSILHDFYCGIERLFERIAVHIDGDLPKGDNWHMELLSRMVHSLEGVREAVISQDLSTKLKEYLRFRHLFRNIYGFHLRWYRFKNLALSMFSVLNELKDNFEALNDKLDQ